MFQSRFPRLYELFLESEKCHPNNYFAIFEKRIKENDRAFLEAIDPLEKDLCSLSSPAWNHLKTKAIPLVIIKQNDCYRGWTPLINRLYEAKGYIYLKDNGFSDIDFIDNSSDETPDLKAQINGVWALLEVKCINKSDDCLKSIFQSECRSLNPEVSSGLHNKIVSTIEKARSQLNSYSEDGVIFQKKIVFFVIDADIDFELDESNLEIIDKYFENLKNDIKDIDIQFTIIRPYWRNINA